MSLPPLPPLSWQLVAVAAVVYVVVLQAGLTVGSFLTGWAKARAAHPCDGDCPGDYVRAGVFFGNWMTYALTTRVSCDKWALHLSSLPVVFGPTHAPIAVHWKDVAHVRARRLWFGVVYELEIKDLPGLRLALGARAWRWVAKTAQDAGVHVDTHHPQAARHS